MKRFIFYQFLVLLTLPNLFIGNFINADQAPQGPVTREAVEALLDSPEFASLTKDLMPDMPQAAMSAEEREQVIQDTLRQVQRLEVMSPEEQQKELEAMLGQLQQPQAQEVPTPQPIPVAQPEPAPAQEEKRPTVTETVARSTQETLRHLAKTIDTIQLRLGGLLRASPDSAMELNWAHVQEDLPWLVSALRRVSNNRSVVETLSSHEFTTLMKQVTTLDQQLKREKKHLKVPDTAQLKKLSDTDLARSQPISELEKKRSKQTATTIIKLLSESTSNISFGLRKMLEKYAADMLKEIEKEAKKIPAPVTKPAAAVAPYRGSDHAGYAGSPYYDSRTYPSTPSDSGTYPQSDTDWSPEDERMESPKDRTYSGPTREKDKLAEETSSDAKAKKAEHGASVKGELIDIQKAVKKVEEKAESAFKELSEELLKKKDDDRSVRKATQSLNDVNLMFESLNGTVAKYQLTLEKVTQDIQDKRKQEIIENIEKQKSIKKLLEFTQKHVQKSETSADNSVTKSLRMYLKSHQDLLDKLQTTSGALKTAEEAHKELIELSKKTRSAQPTAEDTAQDLEKTEAFISALKKLRLFGKESEAKKYAQDKIVREYIAKTKANNSFTKELAELSK